MGKKIDLFEKLFKEILETGTKGIKYQYCFFDFGDQVGIAGEQHGVRHATGGICRFPTEEVTEEVLKTWLTESKKLLEQWFKEYWENGYLLDSYVAEMKDETDSDEALKYAGAVELRNKFMPHYMQVMKELREWRKIGEEAAKNNGAEFKRSLYEKSWTEEHINFLQTQTKEAARFEGPDNA